VAGPSAGAIPSSTTRMERDATGILKCGKCGIERDSVLNVRGTGTCRPLARVSAQPNACYAQKGTCQIWGSHGGDYEECRLLGYKNPVRTSQETHYFSDTETSRLMLCKIWGFTAVTMKNAVFWDIKTHFVPHRRHITSSLQSQPVNVM
jgi:hypothetical protein